MQLIAHESQHELAKGRRERCLFALCGVAGLSILAGSFSTTISQTIWLAERGLPDWLILGLINAQWLVGFVLLFAAPAWPRISWWLLGRRQVSGFARQAEQRVAFLKTAGVPDIATWTTVLTDVNDRIREARRSPFATAWSPLPEAYRALGERYSRCLEGLADREQDHAAKLSALEAVYRFHRLDLAGMKADL